LVDKLGQGRVYTGEQAVKTRLVDELGGMRQALDYAKKLAGLPEYAPVIELPIPDSSLIGRLLGIEGVSSKDTLLMPKALLDMARALAPFAVNESDAPFARLEWVIPER
jgi:ClpP class serine protease